MMISLKISLEEKSQVATTKDVPGKTYLYDNGGRLLKEVTATGETTRYLYDTLGRKTFEIQNQQYDNAKDKGINADGIDNGYDISTGGYTKKYEYYSNDKFKN